VSCTFGRPVSRNRTWISSPMFGITLDGQLKMDYWLVPAGDERHLRGRSISSSASSSMITGFGNPRSISRSVAHSFPRSLGSATLLVKYELDCTRSFRMRMSLSLSISELMSWAIMLAIISSGYIVCESPSRKKKYRVKSSRACSSSMRFVASTDFPAP
jgi:hypothetical protein